MGIGAIIAAILTIVGPILSDLLKRWLDKLLNRAAAELGTSVTVSGANDGAAAKVLLKKALDMTPRVRVFRRALLRSMIHEVPPVVTAGQTKLPKAVSNEMKALADNDAG